MFSRTFIKILDIIYFFRGSYGKRDYKQSINTNITRLLMFNTLTLILISIFYFFYKKNFDTLKWDIVLTSAVEAIFIMYILYYIMTVLTLAMNRNKDNLRYPCSQYDCYVGIANYYKQIARMVKVSKWLNISVSILSSLILIAYIVYY